MSNSLSDRFVLQYEQIPLGAYNLDIASVADVDQLLDSLLAKGDEHEDMKDERIPYWAELWPSAIALAKYLLSQTWIKSNMQVLEIGCGLGVPGIAVGHIVERVILTDYLDEALEFAAYNWRLNHQKEADCRKMDWRFPDPALASDIVLASDVAYEARAFQPLLAAIPVLLKPQGRLILTEPRRLIAKPFLEQLHEMDFTLQHTEMPISYSSISTTVHVFELSR